MPRAKGNRWIVVTGSPSPHNLVAPSRALAKVRARANPVLRSNRPALPESRDPDYLLELQMDAMYASQDAYAIERRMPLADFECTKHGEVYCLACTGGSILDDLRAAREALYKARTRLRKARTALDPSSATEDLRQEETT